jgi:hypothetical protein
MSVLQLLQQSYDHEYRVTLHCVRSVEKEVKA